jgi:4'-phosphopantetheinyl transferase
MPNSWNPVQAIPQLQADEVQVWRIELKETVDLIDRYSLLLNEEERAKSQRRRVGRPREHFAIGRACLRILLGNDLKTDPRIITISSGPHGKPETPAFGENRITFNVAHSSDKILIALGRKGAIGVDVEHFGTTDVMEVAQANFTETESASLAAISNLDDRLRTFYTYWTRKEAITKADGRGLLLPLNSFDVAFESMNRQPVDVGDSTCNATKRYFVSDLELGGDAAGAIALESADYRITRLIFPLASFPLAGLQ